MHRIVTVCLLWVISLYGQPVLAQGAASYPYPDMQATLEDCQQASSLIDADIAAFLRTRCASEIRGVIYGSQLIAQRILHMKIPEQGDVAGRVLAAAHHEVNSAICFPMTLFNQPQPVEAGIVRDVVAFLEKDETQNSVFFSGSQPHLLAAVLEAVYPCQRAYKE